MRSNNSYKTTMASLMPPWLFHRVTSPLLDEQWVFSIPCLRWPLTDEYHRLSLDWIGTFSSTLLGLLQSWCYSRVLERGYSSSYWLLYLHLEVSAYQTSHSKTPFSHRVRGRGFVFHEQQKKLNYTDRISRFQGNLFLETQTFSGLKHIFFFFVFLGFFV